MTKAVHPKVSIIIPVYNGANFVHEAIDSALAQTYANTEVIVVNDGSRDNGATEKIVQSYGNKLRYFTKENGGVASALNLGIKEMTGDYFSWLSHDDLYEKTKIEEQVEYLSKIKSEDVIIACNTKVLFTSGIKKKTNIHANTFDYTDIFLATSAQVGVNGCSLLIPRQAFEDCGYFNESLPVTQDYDLWFRMKDKYKFVLMDRHLVISRRHGEQDSAQKQSLMLEAGDKLHSEFLGRIPYERFEQYFTREKKNIKHTYENYKIYKARGYKKTASLLIATILRYYNENDKSSFYKIFSSEIDVPTHDHRLIDREYELILKSGVDAARFKESSTTHRPQQQLTKIGKLTASIQEDGVYLTGEKAVRKLYKKVTKRI